ncbi:unnamed protein product [Urochloa humidicola]
MAPFKMVRTTSAAICIVLVLMSCALSSSGEADTIYCEYLGMKLCIRQECKRTCQVELSKRNPRPSFYQSSCEHRPNRCCCTFGYFSPPPPRIVVGTI